MLQAHLRAVPVPEKPYLLSILKQRHQLGTTFSNIRADGAFPIPTFALYLKVLSLGLLLINN